MRSIVITGFAVHAAYLTRLLNEHTTDVSGIFYPDTRWSLLRAALRATTADASIVFGGPRPYPLIQKVCNARKHPAIVIWAGSDVTAIAHSQGELERLRLEEVIHWASGPHLVPELSALGIHARYVPVASASIPPAFAPMPREFTVLTYLPAPRRSFYGQAYVWKAARALPDVRFIVVGRGEPETSAPPNVQYVGDVNDMDRRIDEASVLLRLTPHDSMSQGVIEALARGRHVVWTYPYPGVTHVTSSTEAIDALEEFREAHRNKTLLLNEAGAHHVAHAHGPASIARGVATAIEDALDATRSAGRSKDSCRRVAISGQEILSTRVAENCRRYSTAIAGSVLRVSSTSDKVVSALELLTSDRWYMIGTPAAPHAFELAARLSNKQRVIHWVGRDADALALNPALLRRCRSGTWQHLAENEGVAQRLHGLGLRARVVPLAALPVIEHFRSLPQTFTLMLYVPEQPAAFAGRLAYEHLMRSLRGEPIHYIIVGGGNLTVPLGVSAERVAWRYDITEIYDRSTALVRLTAGEFVSTMVMEALLHGRHVMWSNDAEFVTPIHTGDELEAAVRSLLRRHYEGALEPQWEAAATMSERYAPDRCLRLLAQSCG